MAVDLHCQQRPNDGKITHAVNQETISFSNRRDNDSREGRSQETRAIHHGRIEGDGVAQIPPAFHHLDEERLPRRHVEGVDQSLKNAQADNLGNGDASGKSQTGEHEGLDRRKSLRG